jgi:hypothetical protein
MENTYKDLCLQTCEIARNSGKIMAEERKNSMHRRLKVKECTIW